jgi:flagellar biosynthesis/type III secretory pathway protein FliH
MIPDGETQGTDPRREGSHSFPPLNSNASIAPKAPRAGTGNCFKPLFNPAPSAGGHCPQEEIGFSCPGENRNAEANARREAEAFEQGFKAGRQDACSLVQQEMAPQIELFADAFNQWNTAMTHIEDKSYLQILKMAVAIAEKILGAPPQCCTGRLGTLEDELKARMREAYGLGFKLNLNDLDALSDLMACADVHWGQWEYTTATASPEVQRGTLQVETDSRPPLDVASTLRSLEAALSEVSTK